MIKIIALDLDGTLLNSKNEISAKTESILHEAIKNNIKVVLSTGRPYHSIKKYIDQLNIDNDNQYSIIYNGCKIINNQLGEVLYSKTISSSLVKKAFALSKELGTSFFTYDDNDIIFYEDETEYIDFELKLTNNPAKKIVFSKINQDKRFIKFTFTSSKEKIDSIFTIVKESFGKECAVNRTHDLFVEVYNKNTSKGLALKYLSEKFGVSNNEIIAFGDNENDVSMLKVAKYKIAMSNSSSKVLLGTANEIAPSNDNDGIYFTLKKYL